MNHIILFTKRVSNNNIHRKLRSTINIFIIIQACYWQMYHQLIKPINDQVSAVNEHSINCRRLMRPNASNVGH